MKSKDFADFEISEDENGKFAVGHGLTLTIDDAGRFFHRRCVKISVGDGEEKRDSMLVAELGRVRVYIKPPGQIVITKRDLKL